MRHVRLVLALAAAGLLITSGAVSAGAATPTTAPVSGDGSSWAAAAASQWAYDVGRSGVEVDYSADGSAAGRTNFQQYGNDFAISDLTFQPTEPVSRPFTYVPLNAGAVVFPYHVSVDGVLKRNVRLSGPTLADIFRNKITNWNDPAITADNNGQQVAPDLPIIPVVRSDGSATSYHLTEWFSTRFPRRWKEFDDEGATQYFPATDQDTVRNGSDQVVDFIDAPYANGAIGYDEYSYAHVRNLPVAAVRNPAHYYAMPSAGDVGIALRAAKRYTSGRADLRGVYADRDRRSYPLSYYSYGIVPTAANDSRMTTAKRQSLVDFFGYGVCGGQSEALNLGYGALPINLTRLALNSVAELHDADPQVDISSLSLATCTNPTIAHPKHGRPHDSLDRLVPQPPDCAAEDAGPCES